MKEITIRYGETMEQMIEEYGLIEKKILNKEATMDDWDRSELLLKTIGSLFIDKFKVEKLENEYLSNEI